MTLRSALVAGISLLLHVPAWANGSDLSRIQQTVDAFLRRETVGLPGKVSYAIGAIDSRIAFGQCHAPEAFLPPGARLWGNATVGVRCASPQVWTVYVPAQVRVVGTYLVSARPLSPGQPLSDGDFALMEADLTQLPAGVVTDPVQALGRTVVNGLAAGQPLRREMLRAPQVVTQGQTVRLVTAGPGFRVSSEGKALGNAADGQLVQVRTNSGTSVSGIARGGALVEVRY